MHLCTKCNPGPVLRSGIGWTSPPGLDTGRAVVSISPISSDQLFERKFYNQVKKLNVTTFRKRGAGGRLNARKTSSKNGSVPTSTNTIRNSLKAEYDKKKRIWRKLKFPCRFPTCHRSAERSPHHKYGRLGPLLVWLPGWVSLCREHHDWVHRNIAEARKLGLIAERGQWNNLKVIEQYDLHKL